ncbi:MAG: DNA-protecting protein DprA [Muribaculaceae bacterium]|nr:DNA-protecting protein DprA [Muribaculaceae bacterium]
MKLAIVGTRNPGVTYQEWENLLLYKINPDEIQMVISGVAKGVDTFAKLFAARHHKPYIEFAPQYNVYGRYATLKRNTQIVKEATTLIAFPSAESKGTYHSIEEAHRLSRRVIIITL